MHTVNLARKSAALAREHGGGGGGGGVWLDGGMERRGRVVGVKMVMLVMQARSGCGSSVNDLIMLI